MLRFGDIYPDSWEINNRFQDAALVRNRLWRIYDKGRKIWIQTRPNSDFVHTYICTDQTVQYLCANCSFNGRYSRAKLADLPS
uniref:Uncharacterized protein n=1 Tax=Panagrolaimus sp. JU765 TaxID=591449 RepID=A0AC34PYN3_9BILA